MTAGAPVGPRLARWDRWSVGHASPSLLREREAFFPERQIALVKNLGHDVRALLHVGNSQGTAFRPALVQRRQLASSALMSVNCPSFQIDRRETASRLWIHPYGESRAAPVLPPIRRDRLVCASRFPALRCGVRLPRARPPSL